MGLQRMNQGQIRVDFMEPTPKVPTQEDKLPEGVTEEELKQEEQLRSVSEFLSAFIKPLIIFY